VKALVNLFDLADETPTAGLSDYAYPEPDQPHPVADGPQCRKIEQAIADAGPGLMITPLVHGYGPLDDFRRRFQLVADSAAHGVWINRYGYLSDHKLDAVGEIW
jgi:hypothetical protein